MLGTILIIALVLLLIVSLPRWNHSQTWGYGPSGLFSIVLIILLSLLFLGYI